MTTFLIALIGLLLLIVFGVFYCVITLWAIRDEMFVTIEEIDADFPSAGVGE